MANVTVSFGGEVEGEYAVDEPVAIVGRDASCHIRIDNLGISRTHCQIIKRGNTYVLQDMNSANGTFVNGKRIGEHNLNEGDEILIGKYTLKFSYAGAPAPLQQTATDKIDMGDAVHTYVMDGEKIRERLGQMRAAGGPDAAPPTPGPQPAGTPPSTPTPGPAPVPGAGPSVPAPGGPRRAMDHALDFDPLKPQSPMRARTAAATKVYARGSPAAAGVKALLLVSLVTNLLLIALVGVLIVMMFGMMRKQERPAPPRPAATSPAPAPETPTEEPAESTGPAPADEIE